MRVPWLILLFTVALMALLDWRVAVMLYKRYGRRARKVHLIISALVWCILIVAICLPRRTGGDETIVALMWMFFTVGTVVTAKLIYVILDTLAYIPKLFSHRRSKLMSGLAAVIAVLAFTGMWWGALFNRYNIDVRHVEVEIAGLPAQFDGFKIAQFSDIHVGTFGTDTAFVSQLVDTINAQGADLVVFTGDIVNRHTSEIEPFIAPMSRLYSPGGVISILGNHDYGDYYRWDSPEAKVDNYNALVAAQRRMGWKLLLDSAVVVTRGADTLAIVGVENIGDPPFPKYGSLHRALKGLNPATTKILLSHNPAHWTDEVTKSPADNIALTLAGHTHAMQIELFGISPAALRYRNWGGLYSDKLTGQQLYVNIGAGTVGMPMRLGATPEVTILTLRSKKNP